jgi:hypothetical protein
VLSPLRPLVADGLLFLVAPSAESAEKLVVVGYRQRLLAAWLLTNERKSGGCMQGAQRPAAAALRRFCSARSSFAAARGAAEENELQGCM